MTAGLEGRVACSRLQRRLRGTEVIKSVCGTLGLVQAIELNAELLWATCTAVNPVIR